MKMSRLVIQIPTSIKSKLDELRTTGTTAAGLIRHLLHQHFNQSSQRSKPKHL
jgi:hypothetical protein